MDRLESNRTFYNALRNSQPFIILSSLSMIIAAFTFEKIDGVYTNSVGAGIMFLMAFGISLFDQIVKSSEDDFPLFYWGKFFFFGMGLLHLSLVALEFADSVTTLSGFFYGWIVITIGLFLFLSSMDRFHLRKKRHDTKLDTGIILCVFLSGLSFSLLGLYFIGRGIGVKELDVSGLFIFGVASIFVGGGLMFLSDYLKKRRKF